MAPNVITLLGLGFIIINALTVLVLDPNLNEASPRLAYFSYAVGLFLYQTFDGCDGVHARRTGQSGPLGELFDHSIDAINTSLSFFIFCSASGIGYTLKMIVCQMALLCNFYFSTWEEYHTHKLFLSEISGPVEGILFISSSFVLTSIFGSSMWKATLINFSLNENVIGLNILDIFLISLCIGIVFNVFAARKNVKDYYENEKNQHLPGSTVDDDLDTTAMKGLWPFFCYYALVFILIVIEPAFISLPLFLSIGSTVAFMVGRIIVSHLTRQPFPFTHLPMFIPVLQMVLYWIPVKILSYDPSLIVFALTWFGFGLALGAHIMFFSEIIYEFTTYLDVYALSIKYPKYT